MTTLPSVPFLRYGVGETPRDGGCIMQIIDWIDRTQWSDAPPCVHPVLRTLAIRANDSLDDTGRQTLLDLVPRLMHTATDDRRVTVGLAVWCARAVLHLYESRYPGDGRPRHAIEAAERGDTSAAANAAYYAAAAAAAHHHAAAAAAYYAAGAAAAAYYAAGAILTLLRGCLAEYDRLTGRTVCPAPPDYTAVCAAMAR